MASRILSIEIGTQTTRIVEMDYKVKTPKIYQFFSLPTPEEAMSDGSVMVLPEFVEQIKAQLSERKIKTRKAIFVMNSTRIANREVSIPLVKEKQVHDLLITNSAEFFPVDLNQYQLVHNIIEKNEEEKKYKLSVLAVPNEIIASYCAFAEALNFEIEALDYLGNSIVQGMHRLSGDSVKVSIKIDETASMITIIRSDKMELQRNISYGISEACETVMESSVYGGEKTFAEAVEILKKNPCIDNHFRDYSGFEEEEGDAAAGLRADVTESIRALVGNISRVLDYYISRNQDASLERIWLTGMAAECQGLEHLLTNELNIRVQVMTELPDIMPDRGIEAEAFKISEYIAPVAASFRPLNFVLEDKKQKKKQLSRNELFIPGLLCGLCLTASVGLIIGGLVHMIVLDSDHKKMTEQIEALQEAEDVYQNFVMTEAQYKDLQNMCRLTETPNDALPVFLGEMEDNMPSDIKVITMTTSDSGVEMSMTAGSKPSASKALMQLRKFSTVSGVSCSEITDTLDESGNSVVSFTVKCDYAPQGEGETESGTEGEAGSGEGDLTAEEAGSREGDLTAEEAESGEKISGENTDTENSGE